MFSFHTRSCEPSVFTIGKHGTLLSVNIQCSICSFGKLWLTLNKTTLKIYATGM